MTIRPSAALLFVVALSSVAAALQVDFGAGELSLCKCQQYRLPLYVAGAQGEVTVTASSISGLDVAAFDTGSEAGLLFGVACNATPGGYFVSVTATDGFSTARQQGIVSVRDCNELGIDLVRTERSCDSVDFTFRASNNGIFPQEAYFATGLSTVFYEVSSRRFVLQPGASRTFTLSVFPPLPGANAKVVFEVAVQSPDAKVSLPLAITTPLCPPTASLSPRSDAVAEVVIPLSQGSYASSFNLPSVNLFPSGALSVSGLAGARIPATFAALVLLLLLAAAFLYFRAKFEDNAVDARKEKARRERAKRIAEALR